MAVNWKWTAQREAAARLLAEDKQSDEAIAEQIGVVRETVVAWRRVPEFAARIAEHVEAYRDACMAEGVADKRNRVRRLGEDWERLQSITRARAAEYAGQHPGSESGLLVRNLKSIGQGMTSQIVEEWTLDKALLSELREIEQQAAKELGQWVEKAEVMMAAKIYTNDVMDEI